jgi:DDE superfamily endonuclease
MKRMSQGMMKYRNLGCWAMKMEILSLSNGHNEFTYVNFDEIAYTWGLAPIHSYCPKDQQRATNIGVNDTKVGITAVIAGLFFPLMLILKHSKSSEKSPDQTKMTVINKLHKVEGFTEEDGWSKQTWSKKLIIKGKEEEHKVTNIIHNVTKEVKAWNDTVRMIMWYELVVNPIQVDLGRNVLLWCDNCGSHKTTSVQKVITEIGVDVALLPKNMTGELQVLDLVVNGPRKAHIRTNRANRLYSHFQKYRLARAADIALRFNERKSLDFDPPKPTLIEGIKDLFSLFIGQMKENRFRDTIVRSIVKTGTFPTYHQDPSEPPTFAAYHKESTWGP